MSLRLEPERPSQIGLRSAFAHLESRQVQPLFREINEQICSISDEDRQEFELVCECVHPACFETLQIALEEYEKVRRFPTRFIAKPGHVDLGSERIARDGPEFAVVEKFGPAAQAAIQLDPRRRRLAVITSRGSGD